MDIYKEAALCGRVVVEKLWSIHNSFLENLNQSLISTSPSPAASGSGDWQSPSSYFISQSFTFLLVPDLKVRILCQFNLNYAGILF